MSALPRDHAERMTRVRLALDGLSAGDAFGGRFFKPPDGSRAVPPAPWCYSDDTEMALAVVSVLDRHGQIEPEELARDFARRYRADPGRGYGLTVRRVLESISWDQAAVQFYGGLGSMGNGGAMRAAPIGAYHADDYDATVKQARVSAATTHAHPEGQAGAIAVAVAAAWAARTGGRAEDGREMLAVVATGPRSEKRDRGSNGRYRSTSVSPSLRRSRSWATGAGSPRPTRCPSHFGAPPATSTTSPRPSGRPLRWAATTTPTVPSWAGSWR